MRSRCKRNFTNATQLELFDGELVKKNKYKRPIAVELFAGAGGMTLGFEQAGFDVLAAVEIDPVHCATHEFNFPFWQIFCKSVVEISGEEIRKLSKIKNQEIDVLFGGPPCQGFSLIGKRLLDDPRNSLVFHYIRLVLELQPKFVVLENVKGMTVGKHREFILEVISAFAAINYKVYQDYQVLNAANYGVPQNRERLFLLACRQDLDLPNYPQPITTYIKKKKAINNQLLLTPSVKKALQDLPIIENYPELYEQDWILADFGKSSRYVQRLNGFNSKFNNYSYKRIYDPKILTSSLRTKHTEVSIQRFAETLPGKIEPISRFYKLDYKGICNTLRAGTASNKGAFTSPRPIHPFIPRCITVREAARLHSYPDWFRFHVTKWHGFRQIGNSVPPLLAKAIASEIIKALNVLPCRPRTIKNLGNESLLHFNMSEAAKYYDVNADIIEPRIKK
ncbi:DNA cytosine methyltransferase [Anabaena cylindrica FACHB-243]|uniref:Cytosine-specific methyltransferase n=2 Tax=Anabaena TaxID=1163 RepID=K9ZKN6_ANACC|nr:DNA-cytosine methyltransferase [Anabaena cylindrica PCC 7122]MBD2416804.1 DNA cytosine methyltransferase [Anabaena cylindrica FACHB-243]MBY5280280.1 DNA cytosine methyltransferase [Anabaena sp. CCAP 1446/1C]MBY5310232.1 DNA cytosine methyltransferase [Anabaena sp. CCAP 1446/1C]BAY03628.1 DNA-cytosine methyltransferase [Anabaena cylindrica PCC 7122]